jgi:AcrR family transcriptional regulator
MKVHTKRAPTGRTKRAAAAPVPLRKDAARSRAAILAAARELFGSGGDFPMYAIGRRAGVGQATLYRHFADRSAIVAAIGREHLERIEQLEAAHRDDGDAVLVVLRAAAETLVSIHDLVGILRRDAALAPVLGELRARMRAVLERALERSRPSGILRADVTADDLVLVLNMVNGALEGVTVRPRRAAAAARALELALNGLTADRTAA